MEATGFIAAVAEKKGTNKNGNDYTRYGVRVGDEWYNTFDDKLGEQAKDNKNRAVVLVYEDTDYGHDLKGIVTKNDVEPTEESEEPATEATPDQIEKIIEVEQEQNTKDRRITLIALWKSVLPTLKFDNTEVDVEMLETMASTVEYALDHIEGYATVGD